MHVFVCVSPGLQWGLMHMLSGHVRIQHGKQLCSSNKIIVEETQSFWTQWHGKLSASWDYCVCLKGSINVVTCAYCYATWRSVPEFIACYLIYINRRKKRLVWWIGKYFFKVWLPLGILFAAVLFFQPQMCFQRKNRRSFWKCQDDIIFIWPTTNIKSDLIYATVVRVKRLSLFKVELFSCQVYWDS